MGARTETGKRWGWKRCMLGHDGGTQNDVVPRPIATRQEIKWSVQQQVLMQQCGPTLASSTQFEHGQYGQLVGSLL